MRDAILVTGGMGFIGSNFVRYMLSKYPEVKIVNLDKLTYAGNPNNLVGVDEKRHRFFKGDVCDEDLVDSLAGQCDSIVHFAAETHVDRSISQAKDFVRTDVEGTLVMLEAARRHDVKRFVHISTDEVYGEAVGQPSKETDTLMPKSPYAASKAGADRLAFSYFTTHGMPVVITRCTNNYGPYQYPEKLIPLFATNALENQPLPVYGSGRDTRDWIYVEDHCSAIDTLLQSDEHAGEVFNVGAGEEKSVLDIAHQILSTLGKPESLLQHVADRPGHVKRHAVDSTKLRKTYDWKPKHDFPSSMKSTVEWYRSHEDWWRPIKSGEFKRYYQAQYGQA